MVLLLVLRDEREMLLELWREAGEAQASCVGLFSGKSPRGEL